MVTAVALAGEIEPDARHRQQVQDEDQVVDPSERDRLLVHDGPGVRNGMVGVDRFLTVFPVVTAEDQDMGGAGGHGGGVRQVQGFLPVERAFLLPFVVRRQEGPDLVGEHIQAVGVPALPADQVQGVFASVVLADQYAALGEDRAGTGREFLVLPG